MNRHIAWNFHFLLLQQSGHGDTTYIKLFAFNILSIYKKGWKNNFHTKKEGKNRGEI